MASTPLLIVLDKGLAAASVATPTGPFIDIESFVIGSAYGYEVKREQDSLNGNLLYEGGISAYSYVGDNTINLVCRIPADAGPFDFGEVALRLKDGTLFAKAAFDAPQTKYSSLGTNLALTYTFNCLLKLEQSTSVFNITTIGGNPVDLLSVANWSEVVPAGLAADPNIPQILVKEVDNKGDATVLVQSSDVRWTPISTYQPIKDYTLTNASQTWVEIDKADWLYLNSANSPYKAETASFLIQTSDGFFRSVASIQHTPTAVRFLLNPEPLLNIPVIGDFVTIYTNNLSLADKYEMWKLVTGA